MSRPLQKFKLKPKPDPYLRRGVCTRCGKVMTDAEPYSQEPEFYHRFRVDKWCTNDDKRLDGYSSEVRPFIRKSDRRAYNRIMKT